MGGKSIWFIGAGKSGMARDIRPAAVAGADHDALVAVPVAGIVEQRGRRVGTGEWPFVVNIHPKPGNISLALANTGTVVSSPCSRCAKST